MNRTVTLVGWRTPVYIYASDPMSAAGAKAQLMGQPAIELVGPADIDRARVALVIAEAVDESAANVVRAIQRDRVPRVVIVAARFDEAGVVAAVAAGATNFLRRSEATPARLTEVLRQAELIGCQLPEGLLKKAAALPEAGPGGLAVVKPMPPPEAVRGAAPEGDPGAATGPVLSVVSAVSTALEPDAVERGNTLTLRLSDRESEVLRLVAEGADTADIAEQLAYSESTIKGVLAKIMGRLDAKNRCHAVAIAVREGLI